MKLTCPSCAAVASADAWANDANCREATLVVSRLAPPLPKIILSYLSLFRPGKQSLTWKKALRLALEVEELTGKGYVHVQGRVDRDCPARIWAQAMEKMVERRNNGLTLPLDSHVYLSKVAWDMADQADSQAEKNRGQAQPRSVSSTRTPESIMSPLNQYIQGIRDTKPTDEEMDEWKQKQLR